MKPWTVLLSGLVMLTIAAPWLHAEQKLDRVDIRLSVPEGWVEAPDMAAAALSATRGNGDALDASTLCFSHPAKVPIALGVFIRSKQSASSDTRQELGDFHASMKQALEKGGATFSKFEMSESAARLTSTFEAQQGQVKMVGVAVAAIRADGKLLGWSVECMYLADKPADAQVCAKVLSTFQVVHPDTDLRLLNK